MMSRSRFQGTEVTIVTGAFCLNLLRSQPGLHTNCRCLGNIQSHPKLAAEELSDVDMSNCSNKQQCSKSATEQYCSRNKCILSVVSVHQTGLEKVF